MLFKCSPIPIKLASAVFKSSEDCELVCKFFNFVRLLSVVDTLKLLALGLASEIVLPPADRRGFPFKGGGVALVAKVTRVSLELTRGRGRVGTSWSRSMWEWLVVGMSSVTWSP